jgi:hypothetical protein
VNYCSFKHQAKCLLSFQWHSPTFCPSTGTPLHSVLPLALPYILSFHWHSRTFITLSPPSMQPDHTPNPADTKTITASSTGLPHALSILNPHLNNTPCHSWTTYLADEAALCFQMFINAHPIRCIIVRIVYNKINVVF